MNNKSTLCITAIFCLLGLSVMPRSALAVEAWAAPATIVPAPVPTPDDLLGGTIIIEGKSDETKEEPKEDDAPVESTVVTEEQAPAEAPPVGIEVLSPLAIKDSLMGIFKPMKRPEVSEFAIDVNKYDKTTGVVRLSQADADIYRRVFDLQDIGNFDKANQKIAQLTDHMLMGAVLYQRYMGKHYSATFDELVDWLRHYADHAGAGDIQALAARKKPRGTAVKIPQAKDKIVSIGYHYDDVGKSASFYTDGQKYNDVQKKVIVAVGKKLRKEPDESLDILEASKGKVDFDDASYDTLRARIAESFLYNGRAEKAYALATVAADRSKQEVPLAAWIAGLTCWKYGDYSKSAKYFEIAATSKRSSAWGSSAGAYWAARSYLRDRQPEKVSQWLRVASENPRSFYGIIAVKTLGMEHSKFNWDILDLGDKRTKSLGAISAGKRAMALMDAKKNDLAERELRQVNPKISRTVQEAMIAVAHRIGSPDFEMRLGSGLKDREGKLYDAALYPDALWLPEAEYYLDKSLIHAFIRQESKFDWTARSPSGAVGLMQLMPATAKIVARKIKLKNNRMDLRDPKVSIILGQRYLSDLLKELQVKKNLFKLAVAYNAGPGNLANWEKRINYDDDPLFFIESIPASETREFVEKILANYWIYRLKYGKEIDSLKQIASGEWPMYNNGK